MQPVKSRRAKLQSLLNYRPDAQASEQVKPKEPHIQGHIDTANLTEREALAVELSARKSADPHMVDDAFFNVTSFAIASLMYRQKSNVSLGSNQ